MIEQHYTTAEVAKLLACSADTVLRLAQRGDLESVYVGRERRYSQSALEAYINRHASRGLRPVASVAPVVSLRETPSSPSRRTG